MIAKPDIPKYTRYLAPAFFILFSLFVSAQKLKPIEHKVSSTLEFKGLSPSRENYYRNLMMQDIALPQLIPVDDVTFRIDFTFEFHLQKVGDQKYELVIQPRTINCHPVDYFGFDISYAIMPLSASIDFRLKNGFGFTEDSVMLTDIPFNIDSSLYVTNTILTDIVDPEAVFSSMTLTFTEESYDIFRNEVNVVDNYYAAASLLDSALVWTAHYFPTGQGSVWGNFLQQLELARILDYVQHTRFSTCLENDGKDPAAYRPLLELVKRKKLRTSTILERQVREELDGINKKPPRYWINIYFDWLQGYKSISYKVNHRFGNYFKELGQVSFSRGMIVHQQEIINGILKKARNGDYLAKRLSMLGKLFAQKYILEGRRLEASGDIVGAMDNYRNALELGKVFTGFGDASVLNADILRLKSELAQSYLNLARMAAAKGSINMSESYLAEAQDLYSEEGKTSPPESLQVYEKQLYGIYFSSAEKLVANGDYREALEVIRFLEEKCSLGKFECTGSLRALDTRASLGLYDQLLSRAASRMSQDEPDECRTYLEEAIRLRRGSVGVIQRDVREAALTSRLDQMAYDENVNEGKRYLNFGQYQIALYYLNRARAMETEKYVHAQSQLGEMTRRAAKPVLMDLIEAGKVKARGYYFDESREILHQCMVMTRDYNLDTDDEVSRALADLGSMLENSQCTRYLADYNSRISAARKKQDAGDYPGALAEVNKTLELILNDTVCNIPDQEVWYMKAALEYPVEYAKKRQAAMAKLPGDPQGFVSAYKELEQYYMAMDLNAMGVHFEPLFDVVMEQTDKDFLQAMLLHYYHQQDRDKTVSIMQRIWSLHHQAPPEQQQEYLARWIAEDDYRKGCENPMKCLEECAPHNKAFRAFRHQYKLTMAKESGWKFRYLSLFLKNNP